MCMFECLICLRLEIWLDSYSRSSQRQNVLDKIEVKQLALIFYVLSDAFSYVTVYIPRCKQFYFCQAIYLTIPCARVIPAIYSPFESNVVHRIVIIQLSILKKCHNIPYDDFSTSIMLYITFPLSNFLYEIPVLFRVT